MALTQSQKDFMAGLDSKYGFPSGTMGAVVGIESSGNPGAKSDAGATGYFQLMPSALKDAGAQVDDARKLSFEQQAEIAANHLNKGYQRFGDIGTALAGYNAGNGRIGRVLKGKAAMPDETADYVQKFMDAGIISEDSPAVQYAQSAKKSGLKAPDLSGVTKTASGIGSGVDWDTVLSGKSNHGSSGVNWDEVLSQQSATQNAESKPFEANIPRTSAPDLGDYAIDALKGVGGGGLNIAKAANALGVSNFLDPALQIAQQGLMNSATEATKPTTAVGEFTESLTPYLVPGAGPIGGAVIGTAANSLGANTDEQGSVDWERAAKQGAIEGGLNALLLGAGPAIRAIRGAGKSGEAMGNAAVDSAVIDTANNVSELARSSAGREQIANQAANITDNVARAAESAGVDINTLTPGMRSGSRGIAQAEGALASTQGVVQDAHHAAFNEIASKFNKSLDDFGAEAGVASEKSAAIKQRVISNLDDMKRAEDAAWADVRSSMPLQKMKMAHANAMIQAEKRANVPLSSEMKQLEAANKKQGMSFDGMKEWRAKIADEEQVHIRKGRANAARKAVELRRAITEDMRTMAEKGGFLNDWAKANELSKARITAKNNAESIFGQELANDILVTKGTKALLSSSSKGPADFHALISALPEGERRTAIASILQDALSHGVRGGKADVDGIKHIATLLTSQNANAISRYSRDLGKIAVAYGTLARSAVKPQQYVERTGRTSDVLKALNAGLPDAAKKVLDAVGNSTSGAIVGSVGGGFVGAGVGAAAGAAAQGAIAKVASTRSGRYAIERAVEEATRAVRTGATPEAMAAAEKRFLTNKVAVKAIRDAVGSEEFARLVRAGIVATLSGLNGDDE
ncbi:TPA: lytic transglycosylase domain-containing protein [Serratia marcescens]